MIFTQTQAFVYKWTHLPTLRWYIGSRTAEGCHPADGYICSSRQVRPLVESAHNEWTRTIIAQGSPKDMLELETAILETVDARHDPRSYNQHNGDGRFTTTGMTPWNKGIQKPRGTPSWNSGLTKADHPSVAKISNSKIGKIPYNKGMTMSEEQRLKMVEIHNNRSEKTCRKLSEALKGRKMSAESSAKKSAALKGTKQSAEWIEKRVAGKRGKPNTGASIALKGQPKPKLVCRLFDRKEMTISNYIQWAKTKGP